MDCKKLVTIGLFFLIFSNSVIATANSPSEKYEPSKIWLSIPAGGLIGFGLGHAVQNRYDDYGWVFTGIDSAAWILGLSVLGDCKPQDSSCEKQRDQRANTATAIWTISRVAQVADLSIWSYRYYNKFHSNAYLIPTKNGASLVAYISF